MLKKMNTFTNFIACADFLVSEKYGDRKKLVIQGGRAGGRLVGATINVRPDLRREAVWQVPFVDVINTVLDESPPLTVQEFLEWGDPKQAEEFASMRTYCPHTNLAKEGLPGDADRDEPERPYGHRGVTRIEVAAALSIIKVIPCSGTSRAPGSHSLPGRSPASLCSEQANRNQCGFVLGWRCRV